MLSTIRDRFKKAKKSLDRLQGEWWHSNISMKPELKKNRISDLLVFISSSYHLHSGQQNSMALVRTSVQEKTGLKIDQPDPREGTTSTGSVACRAFSSESKFFIVFRQLSRLSIGKHFHRYIGNYQLSLEYQIQTGG